MSEIPPASPTRAVKLESTETDPRFVAAYEVATASEDAFENTLREFGNLSISGDRELESLRRISLYLGTLFGEAHAASTQLAFLEMPRAQYILNRQLIEYFARNRWFVEHGSEAAVELDLLPKTVYLEVQANAAAFSDPAFVKQITDNYTAWARQNPALDSVKPNTPSPTKMVRLALDTAGDLFWYYGRPSIVVHGKSHGIQDVLDLRPDGTLERSPNSLGLNRVGEMHRATGITLQYGFLLAINFDLDLSRWDAVHRQFDAVLRGEGVTPEQVKVKKYRS